ncbi:hypothetical protein GGR57DRAFT_99190 [Xylariaceae sp. FL1272]|nr:hypothetical protein GGR57DRAFT_99190 [Xylariaceae sp. FL1272]
MENNSAEIMQTPVEDKPKQDQASTPTMEDNYRFPANMPSTPPSSPRKWRRGFCCCRSVLSWTLKVLGVLFIILFIVSGMLNQVPPPFTPPSWHEYTGSHARAVARPTYYDILKVSPWVSDRDLKRSYRKLLKTYHPDKMPANLTVTERKTREDEFKVIRQAFEFLTGPRRCVYAFKHGVDQETVLQCCRTVLAEQVTDYEQSTKKVAIEDLRLRSIFRLGTELEYLPGFSELIYEYWPEPQLSLDLGLQEEETALIKSYPRVVVNKVRSAVAWTFAALLAIPDTVRGFGRWVFRHGLGVSPRLS